MKKLPFTLLSLSLSSLTTCAEQEPLDSFNAQLTTLSELSEEITEGRLQVITQLNSTLINADNRSQLTDTDRLDAAQKTKDTVDGELVLLSTATRVFLKDLPNDKLNSDRSKKIDLPPLLTTYMAAIHKLQTTAETIGCNALASQSKKS